VLPNESNRFAYTQVKEVKDAATFTKFLSQWQQVVDGLPTGKMILVPGGWAGMTSVGTIVHLLEHNSDGSYSLTTCNSGQGLNYHPSKPDSADGAHTKLKYKTCIRINSIPRERITDPAFWSLLFSLWLKQPSSEYHRVEVIYDVLLPWLSNSLLPTALAESVNDPCANWRTPQRSNTSSMRSADEALRYLLRKLGLSPAQLKQLFFAFRLEMLHLATEDLSQGNTGGDADACGCGEEHEAKPEEEGATTEVAKGSKAYGLLAGSGSPLMAPRNQTMELAALGGNYVGIYFSAHWYVHSTDAYSLFELKCEHAPHTTNQRRCSPCRTFTPKLAETYKLLKEKGAYFEIVFVSADRDEAAFSEYYGTMPWLALPFAQRAVANQLKELFEVGGLPTLVIIGPDGKVVTTEGRAMVDADPSGEKFPWTDMKKPLSMTEVKLIRFGCQHTALAAVKVHTHTHTHTHMH
jgi:thiol-disulfide isomerase/thioredoxin